MDLSVIGAKILIFWLLRKLWKLFWRLVLLSIALVIVLRFVPVWFSPLMFIRYFEDDYGIKKDWTPLEEMSPACYKAVIASEDQNFEEHWGFDIEAIKDAVVERAKGERRRGASTISQQTAKNVFLWPSSSWLRKGLEVYFTVLIEIIWGKERIMEVYLNVIEVGPGVYGMPGAAKVYYKKPPGKLNIFETARVAACLPNPIKMRVKSPSAYVLKRQAQIAKQVALMPREFYDEMPK